MLDSQLIGILVAAMVAGVVLFRLYTVLGRRTGHEPPPDQYRPSPLREAPPAAEPLAPPPESACARGLLDIEMADPSFDRDHFIRGARAAYEIIQKAYADGDRAALRPLLSDEVYAAFDREMSARGKAPDRMTAIHDARIVGAELQGKLADITMAFRAGFAAADGASRDVVDHWSFTRTLGSSDPNWVLVATAAGDSA